MRLIDVLTSPWAIVPEKLIEIQEIYRTHLRGEKIDLSVIEAQLGRPLANEPKPYEVVNGIAVIEAEGIIAKRMSMFQRISGGVSTYHVQAQFSDAMADPKVRGILLSIDSPGGGVDGTPELANMIHSARGEKPIVAWTDGMMTSAAYWIGAAADAVYISGDTVQVGSIGVVAAHMDISAAEEKLGVKTTEITAGKYKRIASRHAPLSQEGRQTIQDAVDHVYSVFVGDVAKFRGVSSEQVLEQMADGRIFHGRQAVEAGLVDGVSTMEELIGKLSAGETLDRPVSAGGVKTETEKKEDLNMPNDKVITVDVTVENIDQFKEKFPSLYQEAFDEGKIAGAEAERIRIQGIEEIARSGYEKIVSDAKADGKSTMADVAVKMAKADKAMEADRLASIRSDAPAPVPAVAVDGIQAPVEGKKKDFDSLVAEYVKEKVCSRAVAIRAVAAAHPEAHDEYLAKLESK
jgi:signal peptide peptidase SppA